MIDLNSEATLTKFKPVIPYQLQLIKLIRKEWDYSQNYPEILLSGSVGSSKSTIAAHMAVTHCLFYPGARVALCRRALPDIKRTIFLKCIEHVSNDLKEGKDYFVNSTRGTIQFSNGSEIISISWADKRYMKARSIDLSAAVFEEVIENEGDDVAGYREVKMRIGRIPKVKEKWIICCTNPGSPSSDWYKYFFAENKETRKVLYSLTTDNPFLPATYIDQLKADLDPKMAQRMLYGKWIEIEDEVVYYSYSRERNFKNESYAPNPSLPIGFTYDFNIGVGKPMSMAFFQVVGDTFHFFNEVVIEGARTENTLEEAAHRGLFDLSSTYYCNGDAAGKHRDTRSNQSDYDIIDNFLKRYKNKQGGYLRYERKIPSANPPIRDRHNIVNAYCYNSNGAIRLFVYKDAPTLDEGMRLVKLLPGSQYIEDDSKRYQHITTALGYAVHFHHLNKNHNSQVQMIKR